jgi:hypothetical protein
MGGHWLSLGGNGQKKETNDGDDGATETVNNTP